MCAPRTASERVGLTRGASYQNPVVSAAERGLNATIEIIRVVLPEFEVTRLLESFLPGLGCVRMVEEFIA